MTQVNEMYRRLFTRSKVATSDLLVETTWENLFMKKENGQLIPGQMYRITDYTLVTPESWEFTEGEVVPLESAGKRFDIVVTALSESILSEDAFAMHNKTYDDFNVQDDYISDLSKWALKYSVYNTLGTPFVKPPIYDSSIITEGVRQDDIALVTLNGGSETLIHIERDGGDYVTYHDDTNDVYYYVLKGVTGDETMLVKIPYPAAGETVYSYSEETETFTEQGTIQSIQWQLCPQGKGTIYRMVDEFNNSLPCDFKNLKFGYTGFAQEVMELEPGESGANIKDFVFCYINDEASELVPSIDFSLYGTAQNVYIDDVSNIGHFMMYKFSRSTMLKNIHIEGNNSHDIIAYIDVDLNSQSTVENLKIVNSYNVFIYSDENQGPVKNVSIEDSYNIYVGCLCNLTLHDWKIQDIGEIPSINSKNDRNATKIAGVFYTEIDNVPIECPYIYWKDVAYPGDIDKWAQFDYDGSTHHFLMVDKGYIYNTQGVFDSETPNEWISITDLVSHLI